MAKRGRKPAVKRDVYLLHAVLEGASPRSRREVRDLIREETADLRAEVQRLTRLTAHLNRYGREPE